MWVEEGKSIVELDKIKVPASRAEARGSFLFILQYMLFGLVVCENGLL